jgi:hypothetical protein
MTKVYTKFRGWIMKKTYLKIRIFCLKSDNLFSPVLIVMSNVKIR